MFDWQSESDLDSIRNSCDVFPIELKQWGKSTKALSLSGGETWEVWQVEGDWRDTDLCRGAEVPCVHCKRVMVIMMATLTHVVAIGWDWTIQNTKYDVVIVPGASRRASASTMCFAWTNSIDCPNNLGTRWKKRVLFLFKCIGPTPIHLTNSR